MLINSKDIWIQFREPLLSIDKLHYFYSEIKKCASKILINSRHKDLIKTLNSPYINRFKQGQKVDKNIVNGASFIVLMNSN